MVESQANNTLAQIENSTQFQLTAKEWLSALGNPGELREMLLLNRDGYAEVAGFFDDINAMVEVVNRYSGKFFIYITLNPISENLLEPKKPLKEGDPPRIVCKNQLFKPEKGDLVGNEYIKSIDNIPIDIDPVKPDDHKHDSATDIEKQAAKERLDAIIEWLELQGVTKDNYMRVDSGNGNQIEIKVHLEPTPENDELISNLHDKLHDRYSDDVAESDKSVKNRARIIKVPDSLAMKGKNTPERPWRKAKVEYIPASIKPLSRDILATIAKPISDKPHKIEYIFHGNGSNHPFDLHGFLAKFNIQELGVYAYKGGSRIKVLCPNRSQHTTKGDEAYFYIYPDGIPGFNCFHGHCIDLTFSDIHEMLEPGYRDQWKNHVCSGGSGGNGHNPDTKTQMNYTYTDTGNAQRLYDKYGDIFKFVTERKLFIIWNGHYWEYDTPDDTKLNKLAKDTIKAIPNEARPNMTDDEYKALMKFSLMSLNQVRIKAMIESVKSEGDVTISIKQLDSDPDLFNCQNVTIDLKIGIARPQSKDDLITIMAPVTYDSTATCPQWKSWLELIMDNKYSVINYLQTLCGYCMTGETKTDVIPFCHGLGGNGKSTFWNVIRDKIMGDYAYEVNPDVFLISGQKFKDSGQREELANLYGKRLVTATEIQEDRQLTINLLKAISGGESIHGDRKYERGITFKPTFKVILSGNHEPIIKDNSNAAWRRLKKIPFTVTIENQIDGFEETFNGELPGILNWMIAGCIRWQSEGLCDPDEVVQATMEYRNTQDVISQFLDTYYVRDVNGEVTKASFRALFSKWCTENSYEVLSDKAIKLRLAAIGVRDKAKNSGGVWIGIKPIPTKVKSDGSEGSEG